MLYKRACLLLDYMYIYVLQYQHQESWQPDGVYFFISPSCYLLISNHGYFNVFQPLVSPAIFLPTYMLVCLAKIIQIPGLFPARISLIITVPESPRGLSAMALNSSAVLLTWRRPTEREAKGVIRGYQIFRTELGENNERRTDPILDYVRHYNTFESLSQMLSAITCKQRKNISCYLTYDMGIMRLPLM